MAEEKKSIFRQSSLDRISSPEELDQYLQVTRPGTWMILGAVVILLLGFVVWGIFGHLTTSVDVAVHVDGGRAVCYLTADEAAKVPAGAEVVIGDQTYTLGDAGLAPMVVDDTVSDQVKLAGMLYDGMVVQPMVVTGDLVDGVYVGKITVERITPMSFILN